MDEEKMVVLPFMFELKRKLDRTELDWEQHHGLLMMDALYAAYKFGIQVGLDEGKEKKNVD